MKTKLAWIKVCLLVTILTMASVFGISAVFANGGGAAGGGTSGGEGTVSSNCITNLIHWAGYGGVTQDDYCGAGFKLYDINDPDNWPKGDSYSDTAGAWIRNNGVVEACRKVGTTKFYFLSLHKASTDGYTVSYTDRYAHVRQVWQLTSASEGGSGHIPYIAQGGALRFADVRKNHKKALDYANKHPELDFTSFKNTAWSDVTYFCWNPAWETQEAETSFGAFSLVVSDKLNGGNRNSTYPNVDSKKTWEITSNEDKVRVTFAHKFFYYGGNKLSSNTTEKASTNWGVIVTRDGKGYYEPDHVGRIDGSSFGGEFSLPGYNKSATYSGSNGSGCPGNICPEDIGVNTYDIDISNLGLGESTVVCSEISYDPKAFLWRSENGGPFKIVKRTNANKSSTGCVKITRGSGENVKFWSNSSVEDLTGNGGRATSANDGEVNLTVALNTQDDAPVKLNFWHNIHYTGNIPENFNQDICTTYTIKGDGNPSAIIDDNSIESGTQYCANKHSAASENDALETLGNKDESVGGSTIEVSAPQPGNTTKVCQQISYQPKEILVLQGKQTEENTLKGSGSGSSKACVAITRGKTPESEQKSDTFYTGEESPEISWSLSADTNAFHRLLGGKMFYYQAPVQVGGGAAQGNSHYTEGDPRDWFSSVSEGYRDNHYQDIQMAETFVDETPYVMDPKTGAVTPDPIKPSFSESQVKTIVTPDNVGDKICNSSAVKYQDYEKETYYVTVCGRYSCWQEPRYRFKMVGDPYWVIIGATCNPIVKKPTMNVWNGSLFTNGNANVVTSLANRFIPVNFGVEVTQELRNQRHKFGSWSEYMAVVGGVVKDKPFGFGSGASLSYQGAGANSELIANSPLTIANSDSGTIGKASIAPSSTYTSRLNTYIYNNDALKSNPNVTIINAESYNITSDIIIDQNAQSIYDIKQYIIHTTGDINISSNVSRIDAWLISDTGNINTCVDFEEKVTQSKVQGYAATNNAECSQSLSINGPVIANGVVLKRTAGSDPLTYDDVSQLGDYTDPRAIPGEVFNLSADAYLWAYAQASRYNSSYTEAYSRELPPRY